VRIKRQKGARDMKKARGADGMRTGRVNGYARVSTDKQDSDRQVGEIVAYCKEHGLGDPVVVQEIAHGQSNVKPELERVLGMLREGDILAVWELSRLTRQSVAALFSIVERVHKAGAGLLEIKSGTLIGNDASGEAYLFALGLSARIEREMISARTKSALEKRKAEGVKLGRPKGKSKLDAKGDEIRRYLKLGINKSAIAKLVGCSRSALIHWLKAQGEKVA
jgi:DNA invertase Pin-like site-specific DNA recombinase